MARGRYCYREVLPFTALVAVECTNVGSSTLFKAASLRGLNYHVFITYSYAIATLLLLPLAYIFNRDTVLPPLTLALVGRFFMIVILGFTSLLLGYKGLDYSSPTLASAMSNLTPACTFILAIIFRMEKLVLRRLSSQAKIIGTILSIAGALVVVLYEGPVVIRVLAPAISLHDPSSSGQIDWIKGGGLLAGEYVLISVWYIFQAQVMKECPAEMLVVFLYNLFCTIVAAPVCLLSEPNLSAWKIKNDISLIAIIYSGIVGSAISIIIQTWCIHLKGPVYVALFRPLSIAIAAVMGVIFLGDSLYVGSVVGAVIISTGFYVVMWGKIKEETVEGLEDCTSESPSAESAPLLQEYAKSTGAEQTHTTTGV